MGDFFAELKRRNVIRVGAFYAVAGWLVLQVADVLFGLLGVPDWSLRLVFALLLLGLPIVLVLSWAFELTPEGLKRDTGRAPATIRSGDAARKLDIATIALLVVTIGIVAWDRTTGRSGAHVGAPPDSSAVGHDGAAEEDAKTGADGVAGELSIAVLPFANISGNADNEYFSDGLSEELLNLQAKIPDFKVTGLTSSFAYKGRNDDLRKIGAALDVANVLEGSVRRQADRVRITAQLVDAETGYHRWSETYDRTIEDIFAVQEEIATEVVRALRTTLLNEDQRVISSVPRTEVAAYDRYLKGQEYARDRTREGLARAVDAFKDAIVLDPNYAPAWSGLAMAYALQQNYGYIDTGTVTALIEPALDRALALDPDNSEALAVRGIYLHNLADGRSPPEALKSLERAIAANPNNAMAHFWLAQQRLPDRHAAARLYERALELDPQAPIVLRNYAVFLSSGGDAAGAARVLEQLEAVAPDWFSGWLARAEIAMQEGRIADAALAAERARDLNPDYVGILDFLAWSYWMLDENEAALAVARQAVRQDPGEKTRAQLAYLDSLGLVARDQVA
ncbi:MAG TPA: tetratricopeptide repeat protein, partial [Steroidobacteraceae bacterium]|nr:tetratricopeptide repeat protein [Steroidobacteraceae bacterium]